MHSVLLTSYKHSITIGQTSTGHTVSQDLCSGTSRTFAVPEGGAKHTHTHEPEQIINKHEITAGQLTLSLKAVGIGEVQPDANQIQLFQ